MCLQTCLNKKRPSSCSELTNFLSQDDCKTSCSVDSINRIMATFKCDLNPTPENAQGQTMATPLVPAPVTAPEKTKQPRPLQTPNASTIESLLQNEDIRRCVDSCRTEPANCDELIHDLSPSGCGGSCSADSIGKILTAFSCVTNAEMSQTSTENAWPSVEAQKRVNKLVRTDGNIRKCTKQCRHYDQPANCDEVKQRLSPGGCGESCSTKSVSKLMRALNCPMPTVKPKSTSVSCKNLNIDTSSECAGKYSDSRIVSDEDFPYGCISVKTKRGESVYFNNANQQAPNFSLAYQCDSL